MHPVDDRLCLNRRDFLTSAAGGIGGVALAALVAERDAAATSRCLTAVAPRAKSCIFLFMEGGASSLDLFNYRPRLDMSKADNYHDRLVREVAPKEVLDGQFAFIDKTKAKFLGTPIGFKPYGQSRMWFSDLLPNLSRHADRICMINSVVTSQFNHHPGQLVMQTGHSFEGHPSVGSWLTYGLCNSTARSFPDYVVLNSGGSIFGASTLWQSGFLPGNNAGVLLNTTGSPIPDLKLPDGITASLERRGLDALNRPDALKKLEAANDLYRKRMGDPAIQAHIDNFELAFGMQTAAPQMMDLSADKKLLDAKDPYGINRKPPPDAIAAGTRAPMAASYGNFARHCILARKMVKSGVRFVNLFAGPWDHHGTIYGDKTNPGIIPLFANLVDQPIAALLDDLQEQGMLDETLVVWGSEFGRTPISEVRKTEPTDPPWIPGRDHHPHSFTMFMAGGGVKGGTVVGETDEFGFFPAGKGTSQDQSVDVSDVHATILRLFGIDHTKLTYPYHGVEMRLTPLTREAHALDENHPSVKAGVLKAAI